MDKALRLTHTFAVSAVILALGCMPEGAGQAEAAGLAHWNHPEPSPDAARNPAPRPIGAAAATAHSDAESDNEADAQAATAEVGLSQTNPNLLDQIAPRVSDPDEAPAPGSGWLMTNLLQPEPPWPAAMDLDASALTDRSAEDADDEAATPVYSVQVGALDSPADAHAEWERFTLRLPDLFAGREPDVRLADVNNRRFWVLRTGPFASFDEAAAFCARLRVAGISCWTPPAGG
jgi:hypothetical protein